jgi:hypothetical protein
MATRTLPRSALALLFFAVMMPPVRAAGLPASLTEHRTTLPCGKEQAGYWIMPVNDNGRCRLVPEPYYPMPGDILLYDDLSVFLHYAFKIVRSDRPIHTAIVVERLDGTPAILEVGPNSRPQAFTKTYIVDVFRRLESYPGVVMIRRPKVPLTREQSEALTQFALAQEGKEFAVGRLALQGTPFNCRYGLRHKFFAHTYFDRDRWICSENTVAAATIAGLLNPEEHPANSMYPRDLTYDEKYDLSAVYYAPVLWVADHNVEIDENRVRAIMKPAQ